MSTMTSYLIRRPVLRQKLRPLYMAKARKMRANGAAPSRVQYYVDLARWVHRGRR